ncbi:hypothetical protein [Thermococcus thermotolerans]|uniref:hypothetical protein n=1 Tax=Thermococcus thermotolerans TaxID=2969672 RepID=UPI0028044A2B|nr:hypothetical protein [Thermococcus thermotolerans]
MSMFGPGIVVAMGATVIFAFLLALFVAAIFLWMAAKLLGIENASVGRAVIAIVGGGILGMIVGAIVGAVLGPLGSIAAFITSIWVIKAVFDTDWLRAFLAWLLSGIIAILVMGILALLGMFTIGALAAL